jgi:hypothetical protein
MFLRDVAFSGLGLAVTAGQAAREAFDLLARRGAAVGADDGTMAGRVDRVVTRDLPAAIGFALGTAIDGTVRGAELGRRVAAEVPRAVERAVAAALAYAGLPSTRDLADLRARLDALSRQLERLERDIREVPAAPPWEEQVPDNVTP